jgi:Beta-lactamase enzyme family
VVTVRPCSTAVARTRAAAIPFGQGAFRPCASPPGERALRRPPFAGAIPGMAEGGRQAADARGAYRAGRWGSPHQIVNRLAGALNRFTITLERRGRVAARRRTRPATDTRADRRQDGHRGQRHRQRASPHDMGGLARGTGLANDQGALGHRGLPAGQPPQVTDLMRAVITESDNAAAESLWAQLGDPIAAAKRVQQILRETGDPTIVESRKLRPEFTAFGQTIWSLVNQIRFTASAFCNSADEPIFNLMGRSSRTRAGGSPASRVVSSKAVGARHCPANTLSARSACLPPRLGKSRWRSLQNLYRAHSMTAGRISTKRPPG